MTLDEVLGLLEGVRRTARGYSARCPAHVDKSPSLSIRETDEGNTLLHCFAGCTVQDICFSLRIEKRDLFKQFDRHPSQIRLAQQHRLHRERLGRKIQKLAGLRADILRDAEQLIAQGSPIDLASLSSDQVARYLDAIGEAHNTLAEEMGEYDYAEWSSRLGANHCPIAVA